MITIGKLLCWLGFHKKYTSDQDNHWHTWCSRVKCHWSEINH